MSPLILYNAWVDIITQKKYMPKSKENPLCKNHSISGWGYSSMVERWPKAHKAVAHSSAVPAASDSPGKALC